ncbi:MAG: bifunctional phosphopantothenoylcysteine decarboxylase/phosphopantothenate--cysteine ligase CoaBC [Bdellovibrionales bacterium]|nr:bifunctional phosphopantothenoylcysteine decarboxylase/phosphopantothenate--cysteine ligase CoaBC [Bdellovibrionales bacterium]
MISGSTIVLMVGGSIAAYKSAELIRLLKKKDARVRVVLTEAGAKFITPMTLQTLAGERVRAETFSLQEEAAVGHIELADSADAVLVAPATADLIAKAANGIADDLCTTVLLASTAPLVFAPAMNVNMWNNAATQENVSKLRARGALVLEPGDGFLACGWTGSGRLPEYDAILQALGTATSPQDYAGTRVLVTAGATREHLDPIRFVSNRSSGKMGYAIAQSAASRGADVTLISGPSALTPPAGVKTINVTTALEMHRAVMEQVGAPADLKKHQKQYVFMVAAVSDHRPAEISSSKLKHSKDEEYSIRMVPSPDILRELGSTRESIEAQSGMPLRLIGFAAETGEQDELIAWAQEKLTKKNSDLIVGNFAHDSFEKNTNRVWLLDRTGRQEEISTADKLLVAAKIVARARKL